VRIPKEISMAKTKKQRTQKENSVLDSIGLSSPQSVAFVLFEENTIRVVVAGPRRVNQMTMTVSKKSLFTSAFSSRSQKGKTSAAGDLKKDILIFVYDSIRRYSRRHYKVKIPLVIIGGNWKGIEAANDAIEKELGMPTILRSSSTVRHLLEIFLSRIQTERTEEMSTVVKKNGLRRKLHFIVPIISIAIGVLLLLSTLIVVVWYQIAPGGFAETVQDTLLWRNSLERTFVLDFQLQGQSSLKDVIAARQLVLTQDGVVEIVPTGQRTIQYPLIAKARIFNDTESELPLVERTRLETPSGDILRTIESVVVPAGESLATDVVADDTDLEEVFPVELRFPALLHTQIEKTVTARIEAAAFRPVKQAETFIKEDELELSRQHLRLSLKDALLTQVDWDRFAKLDSGTLKLINEQLDTPAGVDTDTKATLKATGSLFVSIVEKDEIEKALIGSVVTRVGKPTELITWRVTNFAYQTDTSKGTLVVDAVFAE
jgi:hypothetical protein